jgi:uncharacterized damage-inducible protein DinB
MDVSSVYLELFDRIPNLVRAAVDGMSAEALRSRPDPQANSAGWLVWHLTRVQDHHVSELLDESQIWDEDWARRFGLDADPANTGFGHTPQDVARVRPESSAALVEYYDAVHARTARLLAGLTDTELDRVVDERWDPPVTLGVRLISVADDCLQHVGQAMYVRGLVDSGWQLGY